VPHTGDVPDEPTPALPARGRITLPGRVVIEIDGAALALAPSSLQVFVRLILPRGLIRVDDLYRDVWVDELSKVDRDARTKIQKRITDLRQSLGAGADQIVVTEPDRVTGYRAAVDMIHVDASRFEDLVTEPATRKRSGSTVTLARKATPALCWSYRS
jgi:DNA-binding winged helix-turn-helix (wHTH) protein